MNYRGRDFSDTYIAWWNDYLERNQFGFVIRMRHLVNNFKELHIERLSSHGVIDYPPEYNFNKLISLDYTFSIKSSLIEVYNTIFKDVFDNCNIITRLDNVESKVCALDVRKTKHTYLNESYIRFDIVMSGSLLDIMFTRNLFNIVLDLLNIDVVNSPPGLFTGVLDTIVSIESNKLKRLLVIDKSYSATYNNLTIREDSTDLFYKCIEVLDDSGFMIKYGDIHYIKKSEMCPNRSDRIDNIVGKLKE